MEGVEDVEDKVGLLIAFVVAVIVRVMNVEVGRDDEVVRTESGAVSLVETDVGAGSGRSTVE